MTSLEPTKTSFLQALNIASKINKGQIEILNDIHLIKKGERVGSSESTLLQMLDVRPFEYGLLVVNVYDNGAVIDVAVLDMTDADVIARFGKGVANVAALSLGAHYPTLAAFPHVVLNGFKNLAAVAVQTEYEFSQVKKLKDFVKNPSAFAKAAPAPAAAAPAQKAKPEPEKQKVEEKPPSEEPAAFALYG